MLLVLRSLLKTCWKLTAWFSGQAGVLYVMLIPKQGDLQQHPQAPLLHPLSAPQSSKICRIKVSCHVECYLPIWTSNLRPLVAACPTLVPSTMLPLHTVQAVFQAQLDSCSLYPMTVGVNVSRGPVSLLVSSSVRHPFMLLSHSPCPFLSLAGASQTTWGGISCWIQPLQMPSLVITCSLVLSQKYSLFM